MCMKRTNLILIVIEVILLAGCGEKQSTEDFITVDVTKSYPEKELILQDIFDIEYLSLETTDEFVTKAALHSINEELIIMTDGGGSNTGNIYIVDRKEGKCLRIISRRGQSGEEYIFLKKIINDEENQELYVNDPVSGKIMVYDLYGNFKRSIKSKGGSLYNQVGDFDRDYLICYSEAQFHENGEQSEEGLKDCGFKLISKQDGSVREIPIPYEELQPTTIVGGDSPAGKRFYTIQNTPLIPWQDSWLLTEVSSDTIYRYSRDHTKEPFIVRTPPIQSMNPEIYLYPGVLTDRYYFLQTIKMEFDMEKGTGYEATDLVYDQAENTIYNYVVYNSDFTDERKVKLVWGYPCIPVFINNNGIAYITRLENQELMEAYEDGKLQGKLKEIAAKLTEESNPVIMIAKYKK